MDVQNFFSFSPWFFVKIMSLMLLSMYVVFSFIIMRQVVLMSRVVVLATNRPLYLLAVGHLIVACVILLLALLLL